MRADGDWIKYAIMGDAPGSAYEDRKIAKEAAGGLTVSTAWTPDFGFETAVEDSDGWHPVQRYGSREDAVSGHAAWVAKAPDLTMVIELGSVDGWLPDQEVSLRRDPR